MMLTFIFTWKSRIFTHKSVNISKEFPKHTFTKRHVCKEPIYEYNHLKTYILIHGQTNKCIICETTSISNWISLTKKHSKQNVRKHPDKTILKTINKSIDWSIVRAINKSIDLSIVRSLNKSIVRTPNKSIVRTINKSIVRTLNKCIDYKQI